MEKEELRKYKKYIVLGIILLIIIGLICGYEAFGVSRPSRGVAYSPLTGRVFQLNSEEIERISMTGEGGRDANYKDRKDIRIITKFFNRFRCSYRYPEYFEEISGYDCRMSVTYIDGDEEIFYLSSNGVLVEKVWYMGDTDYFMMPTLPYVTT